MSPEDIIAEQKADLDTLLQEIDKMQAQSDMNGDEGEDTGGKDETAPTDETQIRMMRERVQNAIRRNRKE